MKEGGGEKRNCFTTQIAFSFSPLSLSLSFSSETNIFKDYFASVLTIDNILGFGLC